MIRNRLTSKFNVFGANSLSIKRETTTTKQERDDGATVDCVVVTNHTAPHNEKRYED